MIGLKAPNHEMNAASSTSRSSAMVWKETESGPARTETLSRFPWTWVSIVQGVRRRLAHLVFP